MGNEHSAANDAPGTTYWVLRSPDGGARRDYLHALAGLYRALGALAPAERLQHVHDALGQLPAVRGLTAGGPLLRWDHHGHAPQCWSAQRLLHAGPLTAQALADLEDLARRVCAEGDTATAGDAPLLDRTLPDPLRAMFVWWMDRAHTRTGPYWLAPWLWWMLAPHDPANAWAWPWPQWEAVTPCTPACGTHTLRLTPGAWWDEWHGLVAYVVGHQGEVWTSGAHTPGAQDEVFVFTVGGEPLATAAVGRWADEASPRHLCVGLLCAHPGSAGAHGLLRQLQALVAGDRDWDGLRLRAQGEDAVAAAHTLGFRSDPRCPDGRELVWSAGTVGGDCWSSSSASPPQPAG